MDLTILMPCLNEAETLAICITKANSWIAQSGLTCEVLIADNGSTDGSQDIARSLGARVIDIPFRGYGSALFHGSVAASGEFIVMGDSDDSYDFSKLDLFVEKLRQGYDLVMGNRFAGGIAPGAMPWKNRYIGNPILSFIGRTLFKCPAQDFHCGLRAFRRDSFLRMDLRTTGMEYASEMVIKANLMKMKICEVPTTLSKDGRSRPPHLRPWRDGWRHLRFMLLFSPRWLFLYPGIAVSSLSLIAFLILLRGPLSFASITFDIHTLFFAETSLILGLLMISTGMTVRLIGMREGLLQEHSVLSLVRNSPVLEVGTLLGLLLIGLSVFFGISSLVEWQQAGFGPLEHGELLRLVSISTTFALIGGIIFMQALVFGFLSLPTRR